MKTIRIFKSRGLIPILAAAFGVSVGFVSPAFALTLVDTAFIVNLDGKVAYLGTLGGVYSSATDINDAGQVVGYSNTKENGPYGGQVRHAYITGPNGVGMIDLGTLSGDNYSGAIGINDAGQVIGVSYSPGEQPSRAFITGPNGKGMTDLGTLGGNSSFASGINDAGQVVGSSDTKELEQGGFHVRHAFITGANGIGMTDLGTLGGGNSSAYSINDAGQVVGYSDTKELIDQYGTQASHAFITDPNGVGMIDINSYADLSDGYYLSSAGEINNLGQVTGTLTPVIPEPASYALMLAGLGLVGFMARGKRVADNSVARG